MLSSLALRLIGYAVLAVGIAGAGAYVAHRLDQARYESLQAQFSKYQATAEANDVEAHRAFAEALQAQIDQRASQESRNAQTIATLTARATAAEQSALFARRLLERAASTRTSPAGSQMPTAGNKPGAHGSSQSDSDQSAAQFARDVADSATECKNAIEHLDRLQVEIRPQLEVHP